MKKEPSTRDFLTIAVQWAIIATAIAQIITLIMKR